MVERVTESPSSFSNDGSNPIIGNPSLVKGLFTRVNHDE